MHTFLTILQIFPKKVGIIFRKLKKMGHEAPLSLICVGEKIIRFCFRKTVLFLLIR